MDWRWWIAKGGHIPRGREADAASLSDLMLLDWLTVNTDRWSGGQIRRSGSTTGPMVFIDNAAGFGPNGESQTGAVWPNFYRAHRFRVPVVERLRELDDETIDELLSDVLHVEQLEGLRARRDPALERIDELIEEFGRDSVLYFD